MNTWKKNTMMILKDIGKYMKDILQKPTYVAKNPKQGSIEYIKEYNIDNNFILVVVRATQTGKMFARTLFVMTERKINTYLKNGYAKKYL